MSRFVTTVGRPQPRVTEAHVRSDNVSTINITTANGSSITITGSHIELEVQNLSPPTNNNDERRLSASRPNGAEVIDDVREDAQTTVDWSADANLARQIEADRQRTRGPPGPPAAGRTFPVGIPAPATPNSIVSQTRIASGESRSSEPKTSQLSRASGVDRERHCHNRKSSDPKALIQCATEQKGSPSQINKETYGPNDTAVRPKRMSNTSARKMSGASDQPRDHREQSHPLGTHLFPRPSRMASQPFAPGDGTTPTAPIAIPRSNVASARDELSTVASFRLGSRFGDPLGENAPPIVSTPPVRRPSLSHSSFGGSTDRPIHTEVPPRSPSPYEREEVVVQNPQSPPIAQSIHQPLVAYNFAADPTPRCRETLLEPAAATTTAATIEWSGNTSSRTPLRAHAIAESISPPFASEPSPGRKTRVLEAVSRIGLQSLADHQAKASYSLNPSDPRPPPQSQSFPSPRDVQAEPSPGSSHTKAKFESIFDPMRSKPTTPTGSKSAAAQVAQGFHPPSLLPAPVAGSTAVVSSPGSAPSRGPPSTASVPGHHTKGEASKSKELGPRQGSTVGIRSMHVVIPNSATELHEQKMAGGSSSTVQEGSILSENDVSPSLPKPVVPPYEAGEILSTAETLFPPPEPTPGQICSNHPSKPSPSVAILADQQKPSQYQQGVTAPSQGQKQEVLDLPKKIQPTLTLVPIPGYGSNEPSPITFPATATAAKLERQVTQERERAFHESSVSRPSVMVPIEFRPPPEHENPARHEAARETTSWSSSSSSQPSGAQKMTPSHDPLDPTPRQVAISTQHRRSSTPSDKPFHQNDKTVSYYKAAPSPRLPVQTTTVEIVSIPNPTHVKTPASHLDANLSQHSSHVSSHKPPFVVQQHPQNPWHGMSPVSSSNSSMEQQQPGSSLPTPDNSPPRPLPQETEPVPGSSANLLGLFGVEAGHGLNRKPSRLEGGHQGSVGVSTPPDTPRMMAIQSVPAFNHY